MARTRPALTETNAALLTAGTLTVSDVDTSDVVTASVDGLVVTGTSNRLDAAAPSDAALLAMLSVSPTAILDGTENSATLNWDFNSGTEVFDYLATGETLILTYTVKAVDDDGTPLSDTETVTITITGSNDAPVIAVVDVAGTITEGTKLTDSGSITFTDLDLADTPTAIEATKSVTTTLTLTGAQQAAIEDAFTISPDVGNTNNGTINWDYTIAEGDLDFLAAGETVTVVFTITVSDANGGTDTQDVTVTITGANEAPIIGVVDVDASITEGATLTDNGSITFTDLDLTDTPTATEATKSVTTALTLTVAQQTTIEDAFTISADAGNTNNGTINWDYTINEVDLDFLAAGETVTVVYTITVDDGNGGTDTQDVTVTITGSNDVPVIAVVDVTGAITEGATLTDSGSITFTDLDLTDTPTATEATKSVTTALTLTAAQQAAIEGAFTISPGAGNTNNGTINWDYTITEGELDFLAAGETVTVVYTITVDDGNGGTDTRDVTVTITGSNDQPIISNVTVNAAEDGAAINGSFLVNDLDATDTHTFTLTGAPAEGTVVNNNDGTFTFDPGLDFQDLAVGETRDVSFSYTATDDSGAVNNTSGAATVTVTVTGTNDKPTAASKTVTTDEDVAYAFTAGDFGFSDIDGDAFAGIQVSSLETVGSLQLNGVDVTLNQYVSKTDIDAGKLRFIAVANANGVGYDSFGFKVHDGTEYSASEYTMALDVTAVNDPTVGKPKITGVAEETRTLTADTSAISDADGLGAFSYQWYRDGVAINAATSDTYTLGAVNVGTNITVVVSYTDGEGSNESVLSDGVGPVVSLPYSTDNDSPDIEVKPDVAPPDSINEIPVLRNIEPENTIQAKVNADTSIEEGAEAYHIEAYVIPDYDRELYSDAPKTSNFLRYAIRPIIQTGTDITEEMLQLFDLVRMKINEAHEPSIGVFIKSAGTVAMSLSIGAVTWVLHGGSIAASMLSSASALKGLDPMPVMDGRVKAKKGSSRNDNVNDSRVDELFDGNAKDMETGDTQSGEEDQS